MAKNKGKNKGKKNNPFGGKKGKSKNNPYGGKKGGKKVNPANYKSKAAKQSFISKIVSDGRVSQSEAKNAAALGISPTRIERGYDKSFVSGNPFSSQGSILSIGNSGAKGAPGLYQPGQSVGRTYTPLIIGNKASTALGQAPVQAPVTNQPVDTGNNAPINTDPVVDDDDDEEFYDPFADFMMNTFPGILEALKPPEYEPLPPPTTYASIGQAAQSAPGVKARRSSASQSQQSSLGTRGSFNRGGLRISNLNMS